MRYVRFEANNRVRLGVKVGNGVVPIAAYSDLVDYLNDGEELRRKAEEAIDQSEAVTNYRLLSPIQSPNKVLCCGINYASHKQENPKAVFPKTPSFFSKLPSSIIGSNEPIRIPGPESQVDYEVELGLIMGREAKNIKKEEALSYVFGYTVCNDVSGRDLQFNLQHETIGKGVDTFCPLGPEVVSADEIPDPSKLRVRSYVNGELRQNSPTSDMLFDIPTLLAFVSTYITLYPGDVITTGTPAGVGTFRTPPVFLQPGDVVDVEVDAIGKLTNPVMAGWQSY